MSGTLFINKKETWMPAGWLFRGVLELIKNELNKTDPQLAKILFDSGDDNFCDFRQLNEMQFQQVAEAADRAYQYFITQGQNNFTDPEFLPAFIKHFDSLVLSLKNDPRQHIV